MIAVEVSVIGSTLMSACTDYAKSEGCAQISVTARDEAREFYRKLGMEEGRFTVFVNVLAACLDT